MGMLTRRDTIQLLGGTAAATYALSALSIDAKAAAQDTVTVRAAGFVESQEQLQQTLNVLERYQELNPGVEISAEFTDYGSYTDRLATEAAGGNAPDMIGANGDIMGEYSRRGVLRPLDEYVPDPIDMSGYAEGTE